MIKPIAFTQAQLREMFDYNEHTGAFTWKIDRRSQKVKGKQVGCLDKDGYYVTTLNRVNYLVHRLIWKWLYDEEPPLVDHENGVTNDNRKLNLRKASNSQNAQNSTGGKPTSGKKGVTIMNSDGYQYYTGRVRYKGKAYTKNFPFTEEGLAQAKEWSDAKRTELHKNFASFR